MFENDLQRPVTVLIECLLGISQGALLLNAVHHKTTFYMDGRKVLGNATCTAIALLYSFGDVLMQELLVTHSIHRVTPLKNTIQFIQLMLLFLLDKDAAILDCSSHLLE
jgi:hypothetical protein